MDGGKEFQDVGKEQFMLSPWDLRLERKARRGAFGQNGVPWLKTLSRRSEVMRALKD